MPARSQPFHALTVAEWLQVTQQLTFSEVRVLYYLQALCPYGDNLLELNLAKDADTLGMGKSTLAAALHSLAEQQYVEIAQSRPTYKVRPCLVSPIARKAKQQQQPAERPVPVAAADDRGGHQTAVRSGKRPSDGLNEGIGIDRARVKTRKLKDFSYPAGETEKQSSALARKRSQPDATICWPEGPWLVEDKLDAAFLEAVAQQWVQKWGGTLRDRKLHVLLHFQKDSSRLPLHWSWYAEEYRERFEKASEILAAGGNLDEDYQQRLVDNARALTAELPAELNPVAPGVAAVRITPALAPERGTPPPSDTDWGAARLRLLNQWLQSDNSKLRAKALAEANKQPHYQLQTDNAGLPIRIVEVQL